MASAVQCGGKEIGLISGVIMPVWLTIVISLISCLGTGGILVFVQFLITRHDNRKGILSEIRSEQVAIRSDMKKSEKDQLRTQLLLMMKGYPEEHQEILLLARRYFHDLQGNWYCSSLFENYLRKEGIPLPNWYDEKNNTTDKSNVGKE